MPVPFATVYVQFVLIVLKISMPKTVKLTGHPQIFSAAQLIS
jgi:hypothetical protein